MSKAQFESIAAKLAGQLVATPMIGSVRLPGLAIEPTLRVKAECVQVSGSVWFRGAMAEVGSRLGAVKGLLVDGAPRPAFAAVCAAHAHRIPVTVVQVTGSLDEQWLALFGTADCELRTVADESAAAALVADLRKTRGYEVMPGLESEGYFGGVATLGLELAVELPFDTAVVFVAPAELAAPVEAGLRAGGRGIAVCGVAPGQDGAELRLLRDRVRTGLRVDTDLEAVAALWQGMVSAAGPSPCVILSS